MAEQINKDGSVLVQVTSDYHNAYVSITPAIGFGKPVTMQDVITEIGKAGVRYNVRTEEIQEAFETENFSRQFKISEWLPPVDGKDGSVKYFFEQERKLHPQLDENGQADYKDLGYVRSVPKGTVIAEITYPTEGTPGKDVRGVEIRQMAGRTPEYKLGKGTVLDEEKKYIIAEQDGHLSYSSQEGFMVSDTITIGGDVDASVGNLVFSGNIIVKGEVTEGFRISALGNVEVSGNVNGATVESGGNVTVKKGIINSKITAQGNINTQFCEYSDITSNGDITAQNFVVSNVYCGGVFAASKSLSGGKYVCINGGSAYIIGTKNYSPTDVVLGDNAILNAEKSELEKKNAEIDATISRAEQIVNFLTAKKKELKKLPDDKEELLGQTIKQKYTLQREKHDNAKRIEEIDVQLSEKQFVTFECKGEAYPGVKVKIGEGMLAIDTETRRVRFRLDDDGRVVTDVL